MSKAIGAVCGLIAWVAISAAQTVPFRLQTNVVQVPVSVTDKDGRGIDGLAAHDFRLLDNGVPQPVTVDDFSTRLPAISLAIAIQTSGISKPALASVRRIGGMIQPMVTGARGEMAVLTFDAEVRWAQDFTKDDDKIRAAIRNLKPGSNGQAHMLDAIAAVADHMRDRKGRKILLLISESRDRGSQARFPQVLDAVEHQGIQIFAAHYSAYATAFAAGARDQPDAPPPAPYSGDPEEPPNPPPTIDLGALILEAAHQGKANVVKPLILATGGEDFSFARERGIEHAIEQFGREVHSQYLLSFPQPKGAAGRHQIQVSVSGHGDVRLRFRRNYWAAQSE